ncbi:carboxymuconolactone decarboxylase family protein [Streptomyces cavernicola]|uniref:Carboxymuconolactone decarboxylase family protein n=1 Tax=Streptomyces cavernicola TaxID=3043613 RepID=A0ABT6SB75_9ACTN|nr:carboxymuconolactone decarboxylase family protein [Streptomyces sp. B-S-A6]MDI3405451.1 carboxymuconolactone decarboxylase family protein [Streptomyces sp. B-S-A6]
MRPYPRTTELPTEFRESMQALSAAAKRGLGDGTLAELVMIRASQINRCAFCLDMHLTLARKAGESADRLDLLGTWEETTGTYTDRERAALALTEAVTELTTTGFVPDEVYATAAAHFDDRELAHLIGVITAINSWNRLMVARRIQPGGPAWT